MNRYLTTAVALLLASCGARNPEPVANSEPVAKPDREAGVFVLDQEAQRRIQIAVEPVHQRNVGQSVTAAGQLSLNEDRVWRVGAIAGGKLESLTVRLGDAVRSGQVLGRIHSHDEHEARASYQQALSELNRAKAAQAYALQRRDRAKRLLDLRAGSRQEVENADAELTNSQAGIEKAQAAVTMEKTHLTDILQVPLEDAAPRAGAAAGSHDDEGIPIRAPAAGIVFNRKATQGGVLNTGDEVLTLADLSTLWMIAAVNEADLSKLRPGQRALVHVRAYPGREFNGHILKMGEHLNPETRTLEVRVAVPNADGRLKPDMFATASFPQPASRTALFVAAEALQEINGVPAVFVRRSATQFESRTVRAGERSGGEVEILEGLKPADVVVVKGTFLLKSELLKSTIGED